MRPLDALKGGRAGGGEGGSAVGVDVSTLGFTIAMVLFRGLLARQSVFRRYRHWESLQKLSSVRPESTDVLLGSKLMVILHIFLDVGEAMSLILGNDQVFVLVPVVRRQRSRLFPHCILCKGIQVDHAACVTLHKRSCRCDETCRSWECSRHERNGQAIKAAIGIEEQVQTWLSNVHIGISLVCVPVRT